MSILTNADYELMRDNSARKAEAQRKILAIESDTIVLINELTTLYDTSHADDKASVFAMRADLISRLTAAVAV